MSTGTILQKQNKTGGRKWAIDAEKLGNKQKGKQTSEQQISNPQTKTTPLFISH
uniref:Uncharacterized protein n=1 Tax=Anopheles dirus TaxID=7168 RepID=A0A182NWN8_9DIPT